MDSVYTNPEAEARNNNNEPDPTLLATVKSGANWFYWIAGLSLVNSAIYAFGGDISFILGLAVTQLVEGFSDAMIAEGAPSAMRYVAVVVSLLISAIFVLFGHFANKRIATAFLTGSVLYLFDGLIYLALDSKFAAGFHVFALFFIIRGFLASRQLPKYSEAAG